MADITSEPAAGFISESVADFARNQHHWSYVTAWVTAAVISW